MHRIRLTAVAALTAVSAVPLRAQVAPPARSDAATARVDSIFGRYRRADVPGCAVGVSRNGQTLLERAYGSANLELAIPLGAQSVLEAGSVSKQFTAAAIVLLAGEGKLALDDPVRRHVPELPPFADSITLRHLLTHTSGLRDWGSLAALAGWPRGRRAHTHAHVLDILRRQQALNFPPGTEYSYSNSGYNLLAIIAERVSGRSLDRFTGERIFRPLGMASTRWRDDFTEVVRGRATAYARSDSGYRLDMPFENVYGNGGLLTTVGDLLRWTENFRPGSAVYANVGGQSLVDLMQTRAVLAGGDTISYALGLVATTHRGVPEVGHSGSTGGYRAYLARYPRQGLAVALLCNAADANPTALARAVAEAFLVGQLRAPEPVAAVAPELLAQRAGIYRDSASGDVLGVTARDGRLRLGFDGPGTELVPLAADRFRVGGGPNELWWVPARAGAPARVWLMRARGRPVLYTVVPQTPPAAPAAAPAAGARATAARTAPAAPAPAPPAAYAGDYASPELGVIYTVREAEGGGLTATLQPNPPVPLAPVYADTFRSRGEGGTRFVRFTRDAAGQVTGFELTTDRVYRLRFVRQ